MCCLYYLLAEEIFMFLDRHLSDFLKKIAAQTKAVVVLGPRQVGKSSILKHIFANLETFVFDGIQDLYSARADPDLFLQSFKPPLILDEVQYVPELLSALKRFMDKQPQNGQYFLTGSQNFSVMQNISESMAGRASILRLYPMTFLERYGVQERFWLDAYLKQEPNWWQNLKPFTLHDSLFTLMWRGGMPGLIEKDDDLIENFFQSYFETYIQKDVRVLADIKNLQDFAKFTRLLAMCCGNEINLAELGREIGIANSTAINWKNVLLNSFIWHEIQPYNGNSIKRLSKKTKGYLVDTGLLCYLSMIQSPKSLAVHPHNGMIFENYILNQIVGFLSGKANQAQIYHWRTANQQEVDLVLEFDGTLFPIEIKLKSSVSVSDTKGIQAFQRTYVQQNIGHGVVLYTGKVAQLLTENVIAVPWNAVLF
jgi:uncharacterized protein